MKIVNNLVRIYRNKAGQLCAVENGTGKRWSLTPKDIIGEVGDEALEFVGKLAVIPDEGA